MSTEPFIGEIKIFGFYFAPKYYALCYGQTVAIASNTALFSLIGTTYGGNGQTTFALPDLQGRMAVGQGTGAGLPSFTLGEKIGAVSATMTTANMPAHSHTLNAVNIRLRSNSNNGGENTPDGGFPGINNAQGIYAGLPGNNEFMAPGSVTIGGSTDMTGSGMPFSTTNPYLVMNYCIATQGIFPSRN
jgi:microcystin-dependent protein